MRHTVKFGCAFLIGAMALCACGVEPVKVYTHHMNPRLHPDDSRRPVRPPTRETFGNKVQFMAQRNMRSVGYKALLDLVVARDNLGNLIWPTYSMLYNSNVVEQVQELKRRNLFLFDVWGFLPGAGSGTFRQFKVPDGVLEMFERELGDKWLGMDNGEQDGRYAHAFSGLMHPYGADRHDQYLNFQRHFERMGDLLGNKMATLLTLNFGHHFLREGVYTMIGAETGQSLPNAQLYYSFIRGAGKQYGVPWFGNVSIFNRWGWKGYPVGKSPEPRMGPTKGTSLALMKKLMYSQILYNSLAVGFESGFYKGDKLSPIGKIQRSAVEWTERHGDPGVMHTPVALMIDVDSGWMFPRYMHKRSVYRVWGSLSYEEGDYMTHGMLGLLYPNYQDSSFFRDESGFSTPTPFGDCADCLMTDAPLWLLRQYPVLVLAGRLSASAELRDTLCAYVRQGGHLTLTAANARTLFPEGIAGIRVLPDTVSIETDCGKATLHALDLRGAARRLVMDGVPPEFAARSALGSGTVTVMASPYAIAETPQCQLPVENKQDETLANPFPLLAPARIVLGDVFRSQMLFGTGPEGMTDGLSMIVCRRGKGDYTVGVCNNTWEEKPFGIYPRVGKILSTEELKTDVSERDAVGYTPEKVTNIVIGVDSAKTIAAGGVRLFRVRTDEGEAVSEIPFEAPPENPKNRVLALRGYEPVKEAILKRPTFFRHYDSVLLDWKYLRMRDREELKRESGWIKNQGLRVMADMTSGINLFPDLRLFDNDTNETPRVQAFFKDTLEKMEIVGGKDLVIALHHVPDPWCREVFRAYTNSVVKVIGGLCRDAEKKGITVYLRQSPKRMTAERKSVRRWIEMVGSPNLKAAHSLAATLLEFDGDVERTARAIEDDSAGMWLLSLPEKDVLGEMHSLHRPLTEGKAIGPILEALGRKRCPLVFEAIYRDVDSEYRDVSLIEKGLNCGVEKASGR